MWLLFHRKAGTRTVRGGETFVEQCPTCEKETRFEEVEVSESVGVWFIDVAGDKERAFRCRVCGDVFDLRDQPKAKVPKINEHRPVTMPKPAVDHVRIDDELADLKRRMGKA